MNGGAKNQQQQQQQQQYPFGMEFLDSGDVFTGLDNQDFLFGVDGTNLYQGITPPISPPTSTQNLQAQQQQQQQQPQGIPNAMYTDPYSMQAHAPRSTMSSIPSVPATTGTSSDMFDLMTTPNGGFGSDMSPLMNTQPDEFDQSFGDFDDSYGWDMNGVMMGDGLNDGLGDVFNDPLNEALLDPLHDDSFRDEMQEAQAQAQAQASGAKTTKEGSTEKKKDGKHGAPDAAEHEPKKRGRKRITSEPSSKRKAQNRAAQRAFRERKEKHVRDLEIKVEELEKASETANSENSLLRAKVDHLQTELKQYRRRLHSISRANMIMTGSMGPQVTGAWQFDFPDAWKKTNKPPTPPVSEKTSSAGGLMTRQRSGTEDTTSRPNGRNDSNASDKAESQADSPSVSSESRHPTSSCATSPEPSAMQAFTPPASTTNATAQSKQSAPPAEGYNCTADDNGETTFCEKLGMLACGNPNNPLEKVADLDHIKKLKQKALDDMRARRSSTAASSTVGTPAANKFEPSFGNYRDPIDQINKSVSEREEPGDAVFGLDPQWGFGTKKPRELLDVDDDDLDTGAPTERMMTCNKIWDKISHHPAFISGELDVDNLCSELRQKAKCSEGGVVVGEKQVEKALRKLEEEAKSRKGSPAAL